MKVWDFNVTLMSALGLDADKVVSYTLVGDGDGTTLYLEVLPEPDTDLTAVESVAKAYRLAPIDDEETT